MNRIFWSVAASAAAGMLALGVSGCASSDADGEPATTVPEANPLAKIKPCEILTPDELAKFGLEGPGKPENLIPDEPGCGYMGETYTAAVYKNATQTVESYHTSGSWGMYKSIEVNGRKAAHAISAGAMNADGCYTIMNAGGGVVMVVVVSYGREPVRPCAESTRIMKAIEPDVPEPIR